jgi:hypothetical protein
MYPIREGDYFSKVSTFALHRGYAEILIEIHHHLAGPDAGKYELRVSHEGKPVGRDKYWAVGDNEKALLHGFLKEIQHLMPSVILAPQN